MFGPNDDFSVSTRFHGDVVPWKITLDEENLTSTTLITSNNEINVSISWEMVGLDVFLMAWLDYNSDTLEIHLAAWSGVI